MESSGQNWNHISPTGNVDFPEIFGENSGISSLLATLKWGDSWNGGEMKQRARRFGPLPTVQAWFPSSWTQTNLKTIQQTTKKNPRGPNTCSPSQDSLFSPTWYHSVLPPSPIIPSPTSPPRDPSLPNLAAEFVNAGRRGKKQGRLENHLGDFKPKTTNTVLAYSIQVLTLSIKSVKDVFHPC